MQNSAIAHTAPTPAHSFSRLRENCLCPITQDVMTDPVVAADGNTYERSAITTVFRTARESGRPAISPMTREPFSNSALTVDQAMRSSIGRLPDSRLIAAGAGQRDAFTDAPNALAPARRAAGTSVVMPAPRAVLPPALAPLNREDALDRLRLQPALPSRAATAAPEAQSMFRPDTWCLPLGEVRRRIATAKEELRVTLDGIRPPPAAFVRKLEKKKAKQAGHAAMTCGASYLCSKAGKTDSSAASCAYCLGATVIGGLACPVFAGPVLVDALCCGGAFTICTVGLLGVCGQGCAGGLEDADVVQRYAEHILHDWSKAAWSSSIRFDDGADRAVLYKRQRDTRPGASGGTIVTLRFEAMEHQQAYIKALSQFASWCEAKNVSPAARAHITKHLENLQRGASYREETPFSW